MKRTLRDHIEQEIAAAGLTAYTKRATVPMYIRMATGEFPRAVERAAQEWLKEQEKQK